MTGWFKLRLFGDEFKDTGLSVVGEVALASSKTTVCCCVLCLVVNLLLSWRTVIASPG